MKVKIKKRAQDAVEPVIIEKQHPEQLEEFKTFKSQQPGLLSHHKFKSGTYVPGGGGTG